MSPAKNFKRQHQSDKIKLKLKWRRPRGLQSKLRLRKRGHGNRISIGYKAPKKQRGLVQGLKPVRIARLNELKGVDPKQQGVMIAASVGLKKREQLIAECTKQSIKVLNYADPQKYVVDAKAQIEAKRALKEKKPKKKSIEEKVKKPEAETQDVQEKQKLQKDKVLIKRQ